MAFKRLTTEEMVELSAPWVTPGSAARQAIQKVPLLAALLPELEGAHRDIFAMRPATREP